MKTQQTKYKIVKRIETVDFPHFGVETTYWIVKQKLFKFLFWRWWVSVEDLYWGNTEASLRKFAALQQIQLEN